MLLFSIAKEIQEKGNKMKHNQKRRKNNPPRSWHTPGGDSMHVWNDRSEPRSINLTQRSMPKPEGRKANVLC